MKNRLLASITLVTLTALALCTTGCVQLTPGTTAAGGTNATPATSFFQVDTNGILSVDGLVVPPTGVESALRAASSFGAERAIQFDPNSQAYLQAVCSALNVALANGQYDPAQLRTTLATVSIKEVHNTAIDSYISQAIDLYESLFGAVGAAHITAVSPYLSPALQGLAEGICPIANGPAPTVVSKALKSVATAPAPITLPETQPVNILIESPVGSTTK